MATVMFYTGRDRINYSHWDLFYQTVNFQQKLPISSRSYYINTLISRPILLLDMIPLPLLTIINPRLGHTRRTITIPPRHHHRRLECGGLQILLYIINSHTHIREISKAVSTQHHSPQQVWVDFALLYTQVSKQYSREFFRE